jgi:hypothetical protein
MRNKNSAEIAAKIRNALMIDFTGKINGILDWYRLDDAGNPLPAQDRDLPTPIIGK